CACTASTSSIRRGGLAMVATKTRLAATTTTQPPPAFRREGSEMSPAWTEVRFSTASSKSTEPSDPIGGIPSLLSSPGVREAGVPQQASETVHWPAQTPYKGCP